jgi:hypothetical protein
LENIDDHISRIQGKLQQLLKQHTSLLKENEVQQKQLEAMQRQNATQEEQLKSLQEQNFILKAASGKMNDADKKEFEQAINKYIREVDKCIGLLSE